MDNDKIREIYRQYINSPNDMPAALKGFNWGAFLLTFIWGIPHKAWATLWAIPLIWFQLPLGLNWILLLGLQVWCGIKGNEWAYKIDYKKSNYEFKMKQIKWTIFALALQLLLPVFFIVPHILFVQKSPDNLTDFAQNAQCKISYEKIKQKFRYVGIIPQMSENEIAGSFAKNFKNAEAEDNTVKFGISGTGVSTELYYIRFIKPDVSCRLEKQNCRIESGYLLAPEIYEQTRECKFYFDYAKNLIPAEQTKDNIEKGYNIFKYL